MFYLLFVFYFLLAGWMMCRLNFVRHSGLSNKNIILLFSIKIMAAIALGWLSNHFSYYNDYWGLNRESMNEYNLLMNNPRKFFTDITYSPYENAYGGFFNSVGSYWNDLKNNIILKILAFCNIFSRGNYYINSLIFNCLGFLGHVAFFRIFIHIYPTKKLMAIIGCFLLPSTLYFSSGIHKDLVTFSMLGIFCYCLYFGVEQRMTIKRWAGLILSSIAILLTRNFILVALIPASVAFIISIKKQWPPVRSFLLVYATGFLLLLVQQITLPSIQPLKIISQKQADFLDLPVAASQLTTHKLEPTLGSLFQNLPQAFNHGFLRPYIWENAGKFAVFFALEIILYILLLCWMLFRRDPSTRKNNAFICFAVAFTVMMILVTGLIIPNSSSIIRYKSIYLPLLITPILCNIRVPNRVLKHINL